MYSFFRLVLLTVGLLVVDGSMLYSQSSVARKWNEVLLEAIRGDFARPTVHARNLFHVSAAMYDAWGAYEAEIDLYLLGNLTHGFQVPFEGVAVPSDKVQAQEIALSYAAYRIITSRFQFSPGAFETFTRSQELMDSLGLDPGFSSREYTSQDPAALGNYIADAYLSYGFQDGSNELGGYGNTFYAPQNPPLEPTSPGNPDLLLPNLWQPLALEVFVDQSGNPVTAGGLPFLSPEWGQVSPFALTRAELSLKERAGNTYYVYHDPGPPALMDSVGNGGGEMGDAYQWGFALVARWAAHLDPADSVMWDISPAASGNVNSLPADLDGLKDFFGKAEGGDPGQGHSLNPVTAQPYPPNIVPRGDYTRVLAEFWADGPDSETPPGHWFTILNYVRDHPAHSLTFMGEGPTLSPLEWDVKAYFALGGAMHDAAITAWGIKGYYDYIRPISAIRWMADKGQNTDPSLPSYSPQGIPLYPGLIETITEGDSLAGENAEHVGKIKLYTWRGPDFIDSAAMDAAGVGWIRAENWWPYQRPDFVTPPFAGYVSGHSTFSRAAAEVLTLLTGDPYFPGGVGEFVARKNEFLVFEEGPSQDIVLQWATYRDASDQTSLSRIWGGIHPPVDDIPGRLIGEKIGVAAFDWAKAHFDGNTGKQLDPALTIYPNPVSTGSSLTLKLHQPGSEISLQVLSSTGEKLWSYTYRVEGGFVDLDDLTSFLPTGFYYLHLIGENWRESRSVRISP